MNREAENDITLLADVRIPGYSHVRMSSDRASFAYYLRIELDIMVYIILFQPVEHRINPILTRASARLHMYRHADK